MKINEYSLLLAFYLIIHSNCIIETYLNSNNELIFVYEHFRHGARSPIKGLDENFIDIFGQQWNGTGELTLQGINDHYQKGLRNKNKYSNFISTNKYNSHEILVYSTNVNRTIMSAQARLNGLFSLNNKNSSYPLSFIPIPLHLFEYENEGTPIFNRELLKDCYSIQSLKENNKKSTKINKFVSNFTKTFGKKFILEVLSSRQINRIDYESINLICGTFISNYVQRNELQILPQYNIDKETLYKYCSDFSHLKHFYVEKGGLISKIGIALISSYMKGIVSYMDSAIHNPSSKLKYIMYSGHDTSVSSMQIFIQNAFGINIKEIPFSSEIVFHLTQNLYSKKYYVIYYYNEEMLLNISYTSFKSKIIESAWSDNEVENYCDKLSNLEIILFILIWLIVFIFVVAFSLFSHYYNNKSNRNTFNKQNQKVVNDKENESKTNNEIQTEKVNEIKKNDNKEYMYEERLDDSGTHQPKLNSSNIQIDDNINDIKQNLQSNET